MLVLRKTELLGTWKCGKQVGIMAYRSSLTCLRTVLVKTTCVNLKKCAMLKPELRTNLGIVTILQWCIIEKYD